MLFPAVLPLALAFAASTADSLPRVVANDNRQPAGEEKAGIRHVRLAVRMARWFPEADNGAFADAPVFAEESGAPRVPGPLIRVRTGTVIDVSVRNALPDSAITVYGLFTRPAIAGDSVRIPAGATRSVRFVSGAPGTYFYYARVDGIDPKFDEKTYHKFEYHGIEVVVDKRSLLYLDGAIVDFHDDLNKRGFTISNPQAKSTCGCGSSYTM